MFSLLCLYGLLSIAKWTSLSDAYGRRILLYNATVNLAISQATIWFAASASNLFGCRLLYLDGIYLGLTSGTLLGNPTIFACVGPSLGGFIVKATGDLTSIIQISLVNFVVLSVYLFALPESLRKQDKPLAAKDENTRTSLTKEESLSALACGSLKWDFSIIFEPLLHSVPEKVPPSPKMPSRY
ncbi:hypothetical protein BGZ54_008358 [Gamsiella multidivaricata]|nr:hypothetical protein BGZ54_008358 [Gamsiella multidivaricata]